ncbi:TolC family protein [Verrucomicrobia bacterium]|jgi:outer membrane protein TolC|nr:TolC family protein [Verrucomicrobiota bacterium]MDA7866713.1 TolC family protein [Verrucomicrobiota bacterium]
MSKYQGAEKIRPLLRSVNTIGLFISLMAVVCATTLEASEAETVDLLTVDDYLQRVLDHNERLQISVLQTEVSQRRLKGAKSIFNPEFVSSYQYENRDRPNTVQQARSLSNLGVFKQENNLMSSAIESLVPGGGRVRIGTSLNRLDNNLQGASSLFGGASSPGGEYVTFAGLSLVQPLLKGAWGASMTQIRLAAQDSHIAFQDYRRELMRVVSRAETLYWDLYYAQQQTEFLSESVSVTGNLLKDTKVKQTVGSASPLDVLEVESALAQRQTQLQDAEQAVVENSNRLLSLSSNDTNGYDNRRLVAIDSPSLFDVSNYNYFDFRLAAEETNPDLLAQRVEVIRQKIRLFYAKNQRMPQLDFTADYGLNGLGSTPGSSMDDLERSDFASWAVGLELRIPFLVPGRARHEMEAVKLEVRQAEMGLKSMKTEVSNGIKTALHNVKSTHSSVANHDKVVGFYQNLLDTQLERFAVGSIDNQEVLETEEELLEAKIQALLAKVLFRRAIIQIQILSGKLLNERGVEISKKQLAEKTQLLLNSDGVDAAAYENYRQSLRHGFRYTPKTSEE